MPVKKWITKKEIADLLKAYSVQADEFERMKTEGYFFKSKYARGYTISLEPEVQHGSTKTGRIVASHTKNGGKRTFKDIWERDSDNKLQFMFRNPWNQPFTDRDYIRDLEAKIHELESYQKLINNTNQSQDTLVTLHQEIESLKAENEVLKTQVNALIEKNQKLIDMTKHNARGAGRKANPQHLDAQVKKVQALIEDGKTASEIQQAMKISSSTYFRYKRLTKNK